MALNHVTLEDKYDLGKSRIFVTGFQALVRLCLMQKERDRRAGLDTAGYVTGYRGSPLGTLDQQFIRAQRHLDRYDIRFQAGINEDIAATAIWGSQQAELRGEGKFDGVFGLWYGKGPGVDRTGDVFRHANFAGTSRHGGVLALMGDNHTADSSTTAHQSEYHFIDVMIPILNPAGVQEILDYGLYGWAMSRFCGSWVALKSMHETVESTAVIDGSLERVNIVIPDDFAMPEGGLNIRLRDTVLGQEARLHDYKRDAMLAFVRANKLNKYITSGGRAQDRHHHGRQELSRRAPGARRARHRRGRMQRSRHQALQDRLPLADQPAGSQGLRRRPRAHHRGGGEALADRGAGTRGALRQCKPAGLHRQEGRAGRLAVPGEGRARSQRRRGLHRRCILARIGPNPEIAARVARLKDAQRILAQTQDIAVRTPYFCSGCPHNTSTVVPEGMRAYAGIGCHYMAQWMDRSTLGFTQMGGEGANWIGEAPFSTRPHVFQNIGDGTYNHSGIMAIRGAIAAGVNITYKLLFNDAVAMTGGQPNDGDLTVPQIARQVAAEGAARVVVVTDEPWKYSKSEAWPKGLTIHHRDDLMAVQQELATIPGVTVLIYDQTCAAEKRRRRKRGRFPDPDKRVIINELVCEGCGDCGVKSNCVSVQPLETEWGRKRTIDQSSCNKDFSCVKGFCPSFVTVEGATLKQGSRVAALADHPPLEEVALPEPALPALGQTYDIIVTGVGGTGVVTIGGILGMAAHLEGKGVGVLDMAGLAQKGGAVYSHMRIAARPEDIHAIRIAAGGADLVLGGDMVVAGNKKVLAAVKHGTTAMVINLAEFLPGDFTRNADFSLPTERLKRAIIADAGREKTHFVDATRAANALFGNSVGANIFLVGYAYQLGAIPLAAASIEQAIELNGEAVAMNKAAFHWGRRAAIDPAALEALIEPAPEATSDARRLSQSLDETAARRFAFLTLYQDAAYAARYQRWVERTKAAEATRAPGKCGLAEAVARYLFKLMAYKDEYEVARLYADDAFVKQVHNEVGGERLRLHLHLAPPLIARRDKTTGEPKKMTFGPWIFPLLRLLAKLKFLRGTVFDPFGYTAERKIERRLIADYEAMLEEVLAKLTPDNHHVAVGLAAIPEKIRGFGHVKLRHLAAAKADEAALLDQFRAGPAPLLRAAE